MILHAAFPLDDDKTDTEAGILWIKGLEQGGLPALLKTSMFGHYGWSTWLKDVDTALREAIASNLGLPILVKWPQDRLFNGSS